MGGESGAETLSLFVAPVALSPQQSSELACGRGSLSTGVGD